MRRRQPEMTTTKNTLPQKNTFARDAEIRSWLPASTKRKRRGEEKRGKAEEGDRIGVSRVFLRGREEKGSKLPGKRGGTCLKERNPP